jgi:hypothetical protein
MGMHPEELRAEMDEEEYSEGLESLQNERELMDR